MSKSLGNVIDPNIVIEGGKNQKEEPPYGADVLRLWVSSVDYSTDVSISKNILKQMGDVRSKIRNTARFLLGNLHDFDPSKDAVPYEQLPELDRYMLHRITEVFTDVTQAFDRFQFFRFFQTVQNFCTIDLSNFYLDIGKDRLYISAANTLRRRSCQTVLYVALENLTRAIAPVLSHTAEDIWQFLPYPTAYKSVFEAGWVQLEEKWHKPELLEFWQQLRKIRTDVNKVLEQYRVEKVIGSALEAKVLLYVSDPQLRQQLQTFDPKDQNLDKPSNGVDELRYLFIVSQVELLESPPVDDEGNVLSFADDINSVITEVSKADGHKCDRCWNYSTYVGTSTEHPLLCDRCVAALVREF